jgi:putative ABC transport system substrate-binding protein
MRRREVIGLVGGAAALLGFSWPLAAPAQQSSMPVIELEQVFSGLRESHAGGLVVIPEVFTPGHPEQIATPASRYKVPAIFTQRAFATAGGLMSYGGYVAETHRLAGIYAGRILKGERPADLPVMQGTEVELIINLKTAKALGIDVPFTLLDRADEVIE